MHSFAALATELDRLATITWNLVDQSQSRRIGLREDALTSVNLLQLASGNYPGLHIAAFKPAEERINGADFEWWIGSRREGWLGLRIQAKREYHRKYPDVTYAPGGVTQCRTLIKQTDADAAGRALYPFYCFYNGWDNGTPGWPAEVDWTVGCGKPANCSTVPDVRIFGCGLTPAVGVEPLLASYIRRWPKLLPLQRPWSWLFVDPCAHWSYGKPGATTRGLGRINDIQTAVHTWIAEAADYNADNLVPAIDDVPLFGALPRYVELAREGVAVDEPAPAERLLVMEFFDGPGWNG